MEISSSLQTSNRNQVKLAQIRETHYMTNKIAIHLGRKWSMKLIGSFYALQHIFECFLHAWINQQGSPDPKKRVQLPF